MNDPTDKLHVINFWATWCGPCVSELPEFQKAINEADKNKVDFLFVSLDFPSEADKKLTAFLKKNSYSFDVALMTETDYNSWIDIVDKEWQGNLPATLLFNKQKRIHHFISEPIDQIKLTNTINSLLIN
jgi:thiol-disulfide isomerase/thioredoxin